MIDPPDAADDSLTGISPVDFVGTILNRRSIRRGFRSDPIENDALSAIIACGLAAPSSKDAQPWCFHVVGDRAVLDRIAQAMVTSAKRSQYVPSDPQSGEPLAEYESTVDESARVIREAPTCLFVENLSPFTGGRRHLAAGSATFDEAIIGYGFELVGIGAAVENVLLAAHALGLSAVFIGDVLIAEPDVEEVLEIRGDLVGVIAIGVSHEPPWAEKTLLPGRVRFHGRPPVDNRPEMV